MVIGPVYIKIENLALRARILTLVNGFDR